MATKKVLIISPHFPPTNSADMHRVRQILNYLNQFGWCAEVVTVDPEFVESYSIDEMLIETIPETTKVHFVKAWKKKYTKLIGLGSISMRSYFYFKTKLKTLLQENQYDLLFFSTTAFHVMALGPYLKRKFGIPFVLDIQDPWRNDFYLDKPKSERPPKFFISYNIDKKLEGITIPNADAIISVSQKYIDTFKSRYANFNSINKIIPFAIDPLDFQIAARSVCQSPISFDEEKINILYIGRGGHDLEYAVSLFFKSLLELKEKNIEIFNKITCYFIGTSYAIKGQGKKTIKPIADKLGLNEKVVELTDRIPYFSTLNLLLSADILFVPGSVDDGYTASKIFPYILAKKPIVSVFNERSSVVKILKDCTNASVIEFNNDENKENELINEILNAILIQIDNSKAIQEFNDKAFEPYLAKSMTKHLIDVFDEVYFQ